MSSWLPGITNSNSTKSSRAGHGSMPKRRPRPATTPPSTRPSRGRTRPWAAKVAWISFTVVPLSVDCLSRYAQRAPPPTPGTSGTDPGRSPTFAGPRLRVAGPAPAAGLAVLGGEALGQGDGVEGGAHLDVVVEVDVDVPRLPRRRGRQRPAVGRGAAGPPGADLRRPGVQRRWVVAADVELLLAVQAHVHEVGADVVQLRPLA